MPTAPDPGGMNSLFPDVSVEGFISAHLLPSVPRCYHGPLERIALSEAVSEETLPALLSRHDFITGVFRGRDGVLRYVHNLGGSGAAAVLESGATILFQKGEPFVRELSRALPRELGFPHALVSCSAFLALAGGGSPWHSDTFDNFVIQVMGEKRWWITPNHRGRYAMHNIWPSVDESFAAAPDTEVADAQELTLRPGSVLYLPRNYWHRTEAVTGPSFSVTVGINRPTRLALILAMLHEELGDVAELLEPAGPFPLGGGDDASMLEPLARCVEELGQRLRKTDLAAAVQRSLDESYLRLRFRVVDGIAHTWETDTSGERVLSVVRGTTHVTDLLLDDAALAAIVPLVLQRQGVFSVRELRAELPSDVVIEPRELLGTLRQLVTAGILRCESADRGRNHRSIKDFL